MPVLGPLSYTLEVPSLDDGIRFYTDAGLEAESDGKVARFRCTGQERDSIILISGASKKRLQHVALRANGLDKIAADTATAGGSVITAPAGLEEDGLWVRDPHGGVWIGREHV